MDCFYFVRLKYCTTFLCFRQVFFRKFLFCFLSLVAILCHNRYNFKVQIFYPYFENMVNLLLLYFPTTSTYFIFELFSRIFYIPQIFKRKLKHRHDHAETTIIAVNTIIIAEIEHTTCRRVAVTTSAYKDWMDRIRNFRAIGIP